MRKFGEYVAGQVEVHFLTYGSRQQDPAGRTVSALTIDFGRGCSGTFEHPFYDHASPAIELEQETGITGVAGHYYLAGISPATIERYVTVLDSCSARQIMPASRKLEKLNNLFSTLAAHNDSLHALQFDRRNPVAVFNAVRGVTSHFNTDDIQHYLDGHDYKSCSLDQNYMGYRARALSAMGKLISDPCIQWVPSVKTLRTIEREANRIAQGRAPRSKRHSRRKRSKIVSF